MLFSSTVISLGLASAVAGRFIVRPREAVPELRPHDAYSSSIGVLGCKIDIDRVGYLPQQVDCNNPCYEITANGVTETILQVDSSGGSWDISYATWNKLYTGGKTVEELPTYDGGFAVEMKQVPIKQCESILAKNGGKLPMMANSPNKRNECPPGSWLHDNTDFFNIVDPRCKYGKDEKCSDAETPICPSGSASTNDNLGMEVKDIIADPANAKNNPTS